MEANQAVFGLHWFQSVTDHDGPEVVLGIGGRWGPEGTAKGFNQRWMRTHETGAKVYYGSTAPNQPTVVQFDGATCERLGEAFIVRTARRFGARPSRIDVACDVGPDEAARVRLRSMWSAFAGQRCKTRLNIESRELIEDGAGDQTAYFGSKSSTMFFRVYTRRGPLRIEIQYMPGDDVSRISAVEQLERVNAAGVWRMLGGKCVWPFEWYRSLLSGPAAAVQTVRPGSLSLHDLVKVLQAQYGKALHALRLLNVDLNEALPVPFDEGGGLSFSQVERFMRWAEEAERFGTDASLLLGALQSAGMTDFN